MRIKPVLAITLFVMAIGTIGFYLIHQSTSAKKNLTTAFQAQSEEDEKEATFVRMENAPRSCHG
jgi:hypothetical protein